MDTLWCAAIPFFLKYLHSLKYLLASSTAWTLINFYMKYVTDIVDLHRRKFCYGQNILVWKGEGYASETFLIMF